MKVHGKLSRFLVVLAVVLLVGVLGFGVIPRLTSIEVVPQAQATQVADEKPVINPNEVWRVAEIVRLSACDNRPGLKMIYVWVTDDRGEPLMGVKVRFDTEPSYGIAYDHPNLWGVTDENGYLEWDHLGKPTHYLLWIEDDEIPLVENIRTDLGNEYCRPGGESQVGGWRPINRPGIYSYRIEIQLKSL
jgi:hypothetical protein